MAYNEIEKRFLGVMAERDFPTLPSEPAVEPKATSQAEMKPTPKNPVLGGVADFVYKVRDLANQYEMKDWVPLIGNMGVGDLLVGKAPEEIEEWAYGNSPVRINPYAGQTASFVPEIKPRRQEQLADALMLGADVLPVAGAAKGAKKIIKATENLPVGASIKPISSAPVTDLGFYSAVEDAALNVQRKSGAGQAFLNDITKGSNVTKDEIKWIGLDDFLQGKKNVTREEVQQYIAQNKVDIQEVQLGEQGVMEARQMAVDDITETLQAGDMFDDDAQWALKTWQEAAPGSRLESQARVLLEEKLIYAGENRTVADFLDAGAAQTDSTKFGQYTLPGGENYREILLTLPDNTDPQKARLAFEQRMKQKYGSFNTMKFTDAEKAESESTMQAILDNDGVVSKGQVFKSSHWDQPNVLAHIRVNDRVDADGKKMLLVEEVQSDWHQAGRDKGYKTGVSDRKATTAIRQREYWEVRDQNGEFVTNVMDYALPDADEAKVLEVANARIQANHATNIAQSQMVPDAPMKDTWYQLALKRVLKYAADNGYERVGLTTGARQAERYDLSKQVDELLYKKNADGTYRLSAQTGSRGNLLGEAITEEKLSDYVGKEIAKSISEGSGKTVNLGGLGTVSQPKDEWKSLSGIDLQVGGEGMKKYYDEVYPQFLSKYGKKWGAKVGETQLEGTTSKDELAAKVYGRGETYRNLPSESKRKIDQMFMERGEPVRYIDITPEMRESVKKGQPMFVAAPVATGAGSATMQGQEEQ